MITLNTATLQNTLAIVILLAIMSFRAVDAYYGFEISNSIWGPLMDKYPFALGLIAALLIGWKITEICVKGDAAINEENQKDKEK